MPSPPSPLTTTASAESMVFHIVTIDSLPTPPPKVIRLFNLRDTRFTEEWNPLLFKMPTTEQVRDIFAPLGEGKGPLFFEHIADDVDWQVKGTFCPISGHYHSKAAFHEGTKPLSSTWATPLKLEVQNIICDGHQAAVELKAVDTKCKNGLPFTNEYTWVCEFNEQNKIVKMRAYMDTDLVVRAIRENQ
ncbi:hypothetical protein N7474_001956 [Penicillium riverlandense]|uniref:uncharacterized protein n=1 Tax=Penicillium riverlandense TaxID=1903569 RepID=UPI0025471D3E|nr:uncharacterized protein N7474_001956 [Penicillium riverlandense]KAJ5833645.1 hypothetical protein N7474_001956 [Penicillium riverlandense]